MDDKLTSTLFLDEEHSSEAPEHTLPPIADHHQWSVDQARYIREGRFDLVDILTVADEIEDVGKRERRSVVSGLEQILIHVLKWNYQPQRRSGAWHLSIFEHRKRVTDDLDENSSLSAQRAALVAKAYVYARFGAAKQTRLSLKTFPVDCPYTWDQIMDAPYELDRD